tara:strand:- start:266 stop:637 length:372 start_codon:yes stop_codon:yes gene_type:complete
MKPEEYAGNTQYMRYEYHRVREGPNYFVSYYKNTSRLHYDPKDTWRTLGVAKFTDDGKALKEWCLLMDETYGAPQREQWVVVSPVDEFRGSGRKDTSFASEAIGDEQSSLEEDNPCSNTKMVT